VATVEVPITAAPSKPAHESLTVIFNGALIVLSFILPVLVNVQPQVQDYLNRVAPNPEIGTSLFGVLASLIAFANVIIRIYRTSQPITH